jgi:saccharopine dehydrogenase (NAD+, L-lysine-forming)
MKIVVIGSGAQGSVVSAQLSRSKEVDEIISCDIDLERARLAVNKINSDKLNARRLDASKVEEILEVAKGSDVLINASLPRFNRNVMEAALKCGAHYTDLAMGGRQFELDEKWKDAGLTALICMGECPGLNNLFTRYGVDRMDQVDKIRLKDCDFVESKKPVSLWSPEVAIDELIIEATVFENGEYKKVPPFSGEEIFNFPWIGPRTVYWVAHEEVYTIPRFVGKKVNYVDYKLGDSEELGIYKYLHELGLLSKEPIEYEGVKIKPIDFFTRFVPSTKEVPQQIEAGVITDAHSGCLVEIEGEKDGEKVRHTLYTHMGLKEARKLLPIADSLSYLVGTPPSIAAVMLGKGEIEVKGVIPPEAVNPEPFIRRLSEKGIILYEKIEKPVT